MKNIGVDVGGTFIKCAIVESNGKIILSSKCPTPEDGTKIPEKVVEAAMELIWKAGLTINDISNFGIGTTGICDSKNGVVASCPNIKNYENVAICDYVTDKTGKPCYLDNDANCAALGEYMISDEKPNGFVFITLGTGVGGGVILNGRILRGVNYGAGEIGHITLFKDGEMCNCGRRGCWERYASVSALVRQTREEGFSEPVTGKTVFEESVRGNKKAKEVLDKWLEYVGEGVCNIVNIFQPDLLVLGGGVSREGDKIQEPVKKFVRENSMTGKLNLKQTDIKISKLFNDAGVVGASFLYTQN